MYKKSCCRNGWWFWKKDRIIFLCHLCSSYMLEYDWRHFEITSAVTAAWFVVWVFTQQIYVHFSSIWLYSMSLQWFAVYLLRPITSPILGWHGNSSSFLFLLKFGQAKNPNIYSTLCLESKLPGTGRGTIRIRLQMEIIILFDESFSNILQSWGEEGLLVWLCVTASRFQCESKWNSTVSIDFGFALGVSLHEKSVSYVSQ